ncbi:Flp pilus assembly protein CpaB [Solidesulfovibrio carbinoliphilus subsp. oakridgensis]|uniref:Flp pilus assembly protein CpaB n=1 Tax=Solidesulfovibrio carbinoliphilus subsp. oakridgensis TaxID=694327 RepID=G7QAR4_9BACT|nr:Flp pilus assembly protein CpaB [Solidesulfovibrio carbinoliphilus]EHJ49295.1 Flp pilus assembly protein CpaB [Solidesulfovibrio carbinoliphilus subsp. oakridgensis]
MKSKAIPHMILAVILALVAGVLTIRWLGSVRGTGEPGKPAAETKKIEVLVAARPLAKGARLDTTMVRLKPYDPEAAPLGAMRDASEVVGRVTAREISQDDPITPDKLLPKGAAGGGLDASVEPGKRALTVKGTKVMGSGGLITPGCRVDVLSTYNQPGKADEKVTKVILENIPVLTTGTEREVRVGQDGREELANTDFFTLMVTPEEAERLALASDLGNMHLALRKPGDDDVVATAGADVARSLDAYALAPTLPPAVAESEPAPADAGYSVEIIRGTERERIKLDSLGVMPAEEKKHANP